MPRWLVLSARLGDTVKSSNLVLPRMGFINDESYEDRLRRIVSADGFRGPANRRFYEAD